MNYVEHLDLFGVPVKEIPCIKGSGAPTSATVGAVGLLYMDETTGDIYKCVAVADDVYTWERMPSGSDVSRISEEIGNVSEQIDDLKNAVSEVEYSVDGQVVEVDGIEGKDVHIITKFENVNTDIFGSKRIRIQQATSKNLLDMAKMFADRNLLTGEEKGVTWSVDVEKARAHVSGKLDDTITGTYHNIWVESTDEFSGIVFPAGKYNVGASNNGAVVNAEIIMQWRGAISGELSWGNTLVEPSYVSGLYLRVMKNIELDHMVPLYIALDDVVTDYVFSGTTIQTNITSAVANGSFDWTTGELKDADGNVVETVVPPEIVGLPGINRFICANSSINVSGTKSAWTGGTGTSVSEVFDPYKWNLDVLDLQGDTTGMSKENAVNLDYVFRGRAGTCSCKWQGSSSIAYPKKNYTIKFDKAFEAADGWGEQQKYCFKANYIDFSHARNVVNAKLWGQAVKSRSVVPTELANLINGGAIDGFPVIITLNGEFLGLYTMNIPKDGWMMGMGSGTNEAILCADYSDASWFRGEATLDGDFDVEYATDENDTEWIKTSVNRLINACRNSDGTDLDTTVAQYLDWNSAIDYYIFCMLLNGVDMVGKNYILATFDGVKWFFSAYDMDTTHGLDADGKRYYKANIGTMLPASDSHRLRELIVAHKKDALKQRYAELRADVLSDDNVVTMFTNFIGGINTTVYAEDAKKWPSIPNTSTSNLHQITDYYCRKAAMADKAIEQL